MYAGKTMSEVRRHGRYFLLADHAIVVMGFYTVFPLLSSHFVNQLGWSAALVGLALGLRQVAQHGTGLFTGALADRYGGKRCICVGMLVRALSFAVFAYANNFLLLLLACLLSGAGGALFEPPRSALAIKLSHNHERPAFYSWAMAQENLMAGLGALLGVSLLVYDFYWVALSGSVCFSLVAIMNWFYLPDYRISRGQHDWRQSIAKVLADHNYVGLVLSFSGYFLLYMQTMLLLPLHMQTLTGNSQSIAWMFILHSGLSLVMGLGLANKLTRYLQTQQQILSGLVLLVLSMIGLAWSQTLSAAWLSLGLFYLGLLLVEPARENLLAQYTPAQARASYTGFARMGLAIGGLIGYLAGGRLFDYAKTNDNSALIFYSLGGIAFLTLMILAYRFKQLNAVQANAALLADCNS